MWRINIVVVDVDVVVVGGDATNKEDDGDEAVQGVRSHCTAPERRIVKETRDCIATDIRSEEGHKRGKTLISLSPRAATLLGSFGFVGGVDHGRSCASRCGSPRVEAPTDACPSSDCQSVILLAGRRGT